MRCSQTILGTSRHTNRTTDKLIKIDCGRRRNEELGTPLAEAIACTHVYEQGHIIVRYVEAFNLSHKPFIISGAAESRCRKKRRRKTDHN